MKRTAMIFLIAILAISCNSDKEKELLERELELAKRELELSKKESKINGTSQRTEEEVNTERTTYNTSSPTPPTKPRKPVDPTESMRNKEKYNPMDYLKMDFNYAGQSYQKGKGLLKIRTETKYKHYAEVNVYNNAVYTTYNRAEIEVKYLSKSGNIVGTQRFKMDKYLNPKKSTFSKFLLNVPNGTSKVGGSLISVSTVN